MKSRLDSAWSRKFNGYEKGFFMASECFFVCLFWSHIARLGDEAFVVVIDCQALNLHTYIWIQKDVLQYCQISSGHVVERMFLGATKQQQICYQAAKEIKMYFKMSL